MPPHIVIIGGGFAGLSAAMRLRRLAQRQQCRVTLISAQPEFVFIPSLPWLVVGLAREKQIVKPLKRTKVAKFAEIIIATALSLDPARQRVTTTAGDFHYDALIIAAGCVHDAQAVPGYAQHAWSLEPLQQARQLRDKLRSNSIRRVVVAAHSYSPCQFGLYETAFLLARQGRQVHLVTTALDLSTIGDPQLHKAWATAARHVGMQFHTGRNLMEILPDAVILDDGTRLDSDLTIAAPPPRAPEFTSYLHPGITRSGLLLTHDTLQCVAWETIYGAGNVVSLLPPSLASTAEMTGNLAAHNVAIALGLEKAEPRAFHPDLLLLHETGRNWGIAGYYHPAPGYGPPRRRLLAGWLVGLIKEPFCRLWMSTRI